MSDRLRVLELFCGIGGCAAALGADVGIAAAVDISRKALNVYARNFQHPATAREIASIPVATLRQWDADLWWLSPPCQPYTQRGLQRDVDDPRAESLLVLLERIAELRPRYVALENVPGFVGSRAHARLREVLAACGYTVQERLLCPTELGVPNRRQRFYLVAGQQSLLQWPVYGKQPFQLADFLDREIDPQLWVTDGFVKQYAGALHLVELADAHAECACFTSAYGRSPVSSGSYLATPAGVRRFSPQEILRLLGFPATYSLPPEMPPREAWPLVGNSLSVAAVRFVLSSIPELHDSLRSAA
jgi:DNA (cytosine-5)-methyltransferase 1